MKKILLALLLCVLLLAPVAAHSASVVINFAWDPNTETDIKEYRLYRTDGARTQIGVVQHPTVTFTWNGTVPDGSSGTMSFVATAADTFGNESGDSNTVTYAYDFSPPVAPKNFRKQ